MPDNRIAKPDERGKKLRFAVLVEIAGDCLKERDRLESEARRVATEFWREETAHQRRTGERFKYTPRLLVRSWGITLGWQRKSSTIYGPKRGAGAGHIGPKWKYLKLGKKKRYTLEQFTARKLSDREREAIDRAEAEFALIRMQGNLLREIGFKISREATALGFRLHEHVPGLGLGESGGKEESDGE